MFGYVQIRKPELKIKDYELYRSFYCGLCRRLLERHGMRGRVTLTYDMTFLVVLLASCTEAPVTTEKRRCMMHPTAKHKESICCHTDYAADMNVLLTWCHFLDDRMDEKSLKALGGIRLFEGAAKNISSRYPGQYERIRRALHRLSLLEKQPVTDQTPMKAASCFGQLMVVLAEGALHKEENFKYGKNLLNKDSDSSNDRLTIMDERARKHLSRLFFHLGRFIYLMDACDDYAEDIQKGRYNPLVTLCASESASSTLTANAGPTPASTSDACPKDRCRKETPSPAVHSPRVEELLMDEAAKAAAHFEQLPCVLYADILRNILYAGIWNRYDALKRQ